ncbi:MAG: hypothetical protein V7K48_25685 [Nostoc sp.]
MKQFENKDNRLAYEHPKLRKHGTIHDMTLTTSSSGTNDSAYYANVVVS